MKLEMINMLFNGMTRYGIIIMSLLVMAFNLMRLQSSFWYKPFGKDKENLFQVIPMSIMLIGNYIAIFNTTK